MRKETVSSQTKKLLRRARLEQNGCVTPNRFKQEKDYLHASVNGKITTANRIIWEYFMGPIPEGLDVLHDCDNKFCINIFHLHLGDDRQNQIEVCERGISKRLKLSPEKVRAIRSDLTAGLSHREIGEKFGVAKSTIGNVSSNRAWTFVQ